MEENFLKMWNKLLLGYGRLFSGFLCGFHINVFIVLFFVQHVIVAKWVAYLWPVNNQHAVNWKIQDHYPSFKSSFLSPCNALRCGYSNAAVVPCMGTSVRGPCEHDRDYTVACFFIKLGRHVNHDERMNPIDFWGQRSTVNVTMDMYGNKLVNRIETKLLCISLSNLADILTMVRGWNLLILEVKG